jgi:hypothetical protein
VNASSGWTARYGHTSVALPDGSIVLAGGRVGSGDVEERHVAVGGQRCTWRSRTRVPGGRFDMATPASRCRMEASSHGRF